MSQLTKNFRTEEFFVSADYPELVDHINRTPLDLIKMFYLSRIFLQPIRDKFGPVAILSGKRSIQLNDAVGGADNSDHLYESFSAAVDFTTPNSVLLASYDFIKDFRAGSYGQLILYINHNFIHLSLPSKKHINEYWIEHK